MLEKAEITNNNKHPGRGGSSLPRPCAAQRPNFKIPLPRNFATRPTEYTHAKFKRPRPSGLGALIRVLTDGHTDV